MAPQASFSMPLGLGCNAPGRDVGQPGDLLDLEFVTAGQALRSKRQHISVKQQASHKPSLALASILLPLRASAASPSMAIVLWRAPSGSRFAAGRISARGRAEH